MRPICFDRTYKFGIGIWFLVVQCTEVSFVSFLSGGFYTMAVSNESTQKVTGKTHLCKVKTISSTGVRSPWCLVFGFYWPLQCNEKNRKRDMCNGYFTLFYSLYNCLFLANSYIHALCSLHNSKNCLTFSLSKKGQ